MKPYLSRGDRRTMAFLLAAIAAAVGLLLLPKESKETLASADSLHHESRRPQSYYQNDYKAGRSYRYARPQQEAETFDFDPNEADSTTLLRLGLQPWQVENIYRYRARGGVYRKPEDFARLYGLTQKDYERLKPHIRISEAYRPAAELLHSDTVRKAAAPKQEKLAQGEKIDINKADTAELRRIPGIGPYFARQIVWQRKRLGGFHSLSQLKDIKDFPEASLAYMSLDRRKLKKINVNKMSYSQLRDHPYVSYYLARGIIDYRRMHGPLKSLNDLRMLPKVSEADLERLAPYVEF